MMVAHAVIPARFLTLTAHLVLNAMLFWSRDGNVLACLPVTQGRESTQYAIKDTQFLVALSLTMLFTMVELAGFLSGLSLFSSLSGMFSTAAHVAATICSALFTVNDWSCDSYWYIFCFCSFPALVVEVIVIITTLIFKIFK